MGFNLKGVDTGGGGSAIPAGRYNLRIEKSELTQATTGKDMIKLQMSVLDGNYKGRMCFDQLVLTESALWKVKTLLEAVGSKLINSENVEPEEVAAELTYKTLSAYLEEGKTSTGNPTNNVKAYQSISKPEVESNTNLVF